MRKLILFLSLLLLSLSQGQDIKSVEAKGIGVNRNDALQDALRNAVSQAVGVVLSSQTSVENFMVISDAIATNTQGYIKSYAVLNEKQNNDNYEINVKAEVTTISLKADFNLLAKGVGGVRFLAFYDPRTINASQKNDYDFAIDQINKYFASKKYRYIERSRFVALQKETILMMEDHDTSGISYAQQLALLADAQFVIMIKNIRKESQSEQFDTRVKSRVVVDAVTMDNCTGEGLGTVSLQGSWQDGNAQVNQPGISSAMQSDMDTLLGTFSTYIGNWINNGTPFELRFYASGTYRDLRDLKSKLKSDQAFGGDMEIVSASDFTKFNCTYKNKPDELADKILDYSDQIPGLKDKKLDVKLIYGRQISFAPQGVVIKKNKIKDAVKEHDANNKVEGSKPTSEESNGKGEEKDLDDVSSALDTTLYGGLTIFSETGEKFWLIVNGTKINETPLAKVVVDKVVEDGAKVKVIFANTKLPSVDDNLTVFGRVTGLVFKNTYVLKKKKDRYVIKLVSNKQVGRRFKDENHNGENDYTENPAGVIPPPPNPTGTIPPPTTSPQNGGSTTTTTNSQTNVGCTVAMTEPEFNEAFERMKDTYANKLDLKVVAVVLKNNCINLNQVQRMVAACSFDDDKLITAKYVYNACVDKKKYYLLNNLFTFPNTKKEFNSFLIQQN